MPDLLHSKHPTFCEGGIACERAQTTPGDWEHRGHTTTFYVRDQRITLELLRADGQSRSRPYTRGPVEVELRLTETGFADKDGNEISVAAQLEPRDVDRLWGFLDDYRREQLRYTEDPVFSTCDSDADELPRRDGMTKAQEVWNALEIGRDLGRDEAGGES